MTPLAFIDCETLGLDIDLHAVWEVALILRDEDGKESEHEWFLPVENLAFADRFALDLGGFDDRHPQGLANIDPKDGRYGKVAEDQLTSLESFARQFISLTRGAHWIGNVPSFDEERIRRIVKSSGLLHGWHYHLTDVENLTVGRLANSSPDTLPEGLLSPPWDSTQLSLAIGIGPEKYAKHTALGDARWARDVYDAVMS